MDETVQKLLKAAEKKQQEDEEAEQEEDESSAASDSESEEDEVIRASKARMALHGTYEWRLQFGYPKKIEPDPAE